MRVSCSMICWNEEKTIDLALKSVADLVDEVVIVDTGSFDNTKKVAQETMDDLGIGGQIKDIGITRLADARIKSFSLCEGDWIVVQDSNLVLSNSLKREIKENIRKHPNCIGAVKSLNLIGDYRHYFSNRHFMAHHRVVINRETAHWDEVRPDRPAFLGHHINYKNWAVNLSRVRPAWRYWLRGEPFDREHYGILARRSNDGHKTPTNFQYLWQVENKYASILKFLEDTRGINLDYVKKVSPEWFLDMIQREALKLTGAYMLGMPEIILDELEEPRYELVYDRGTIIGRRPEL